MEYRAKSVAVVLTLLSLGLHFCVSHNNEAPFLGDASHYEPIRLPTNEEDLPKPSHVVKRDVGSLNGAASEEAEDQYCFQFTWPGSSFDNTTDLCKDAKKAKQPCFLPYVLSNETNTVPDIDALDVYCDNGNNCNVYCKLTSGKNCIRYAFYRDGYMYNATYFCGIVSETTNRKTDTVPLDTGCDTSQVGSFQLEACYCQTNKCNKYQN